MKIVCEEIFGLENKGQKMSTGGAPSSSSYHLPPGCQGTNNANNSGLTAFFPLTKKLGGGGAGGASNKGGGGGANFHKSENTLYPSSQGQTPPASRHTVPQNTSIHPLSWIVSYKIYHKLKTKNDGARL